MSAPVHEIIRNPAEFAAKVQAYIDACMSTNELITVVGLAMHLGIHSQRVSEWLAKYDGAGDSTELIADAIKKLKDASQWQLQQECFKKNKAMALALGKCMHGWIEEQHIKHDVSGGVQVSVDFALPIALASKQDSKRGKQA